MNKSSLKNMKSYLNEYAISKEDRLETPLLGKLFDVLDDYKYEEMSEVSRLFIIEACICESNKPSEYLQNLRDELYTRVSKIKHSENISNDHFISFDAPEGAGKTTQVKILAEHLEKTGFDVVLTKEPGGSDLGLKLREILLDKENVFSSPIVEILLMEAARAEHVDKLILPSLKRGSWVICDRYVDSTMAYQGYASNISKEAIESFNDVATKSLLPKKTIVLDVSLDQGMGRAEKRGELDRIELAGAEYHQKVRDGYLSIASDQPERVKIIDGGRSIEEVSCDVIKEFMPPIKRALFLERRDSRVNTRSP